MINKIITDSLLRLKRVVVPQFGAFIHKEGDGVVVFVSFLKKDDGVLSSLVRSSCGVSQNDADEMISEYVAYVKSTVESSGSFLIEGLGSIKIDANGLYHLNYTPSPSSVASVSAASAARRASDDASVTSTGVVDPIKSASPIQVGASAQANQVVPVASVTSVISEGVKPVSMTNQMSASSPTSAPVTRTAQVGESTVAATQLRPQVVADSKSNSTQVGQQFRSQQPEQQPLTQQSRAQERVQPIPPSTSTMQVRPTPQPRPQVVPGSKPNVTQSGQQSNQQTNLQRPIQQPRAQAEVQNQPQTRVQQAQSTPAASPIPAPQTRVQPPQSVGQPQQHRPTVASQRPTTPLRAEKRTSGHQKPQRDDDKFMIIAILAAIIAVAAIAYGLFSSDGGPDMEQIMRSVEQAKDTVMVDNK